MQEEHEKTLGTKSMNSIFVFREIIFVNLSRGCGHFPRLVMQPYQGSADTPKDSYFQVMF